jgi:hypothetical protein
VDVIFISALGICVILFFYVFLDGYIRVFPLIFLSIGYFISYKSLGFAFSVTLKRCFDIILKTATSLVFVFTFPLFFFYAIIKKLLEPIINTVSKRLADRKLKTIIKKSKQRIDAFFKGV